jgi:hypothetical protein
MKRSEGGRGLLQVEMENKLSYIGVDQYLFRTQDWMMKCVKAHEENKKRYSISRKAADYKKELTCENIICSYEDTATSAAKKIKQIAKRATLLQLSERWKQKPLHGQFAKRSMQADIDRERTFSWLKSSGLKIETEGFILAAQDQSLKTKNYISKIMKIGNPSCRFCGQFQETIDHLVSGCPTLAKSDYILRHNRVAQYIHWCVCNYYNLDSADKWYEHQTPPVVENADVSILWDFGIHTDRTIVANRPDIVIRDKKKRTALLLDVSIPSDRNTSLKSFEKLSKYKDLEIELEKSWKCKIKTIPVIIGALGVINKSTNKYVKEIPGNISLIEIQKTALLGTARILRKALSLNVI